MGMVQKLQTLVHHSLPWNVFNGNGVQIFLEHFSPTPTRLVTETGHGSCAVRGDPTGLLAAPSGYGSVGQGLGVQFSWVQHIDSTWRRRRYRLAFSPKASWGVS